MRCRDDNGGRRDADTPSVRYVFLFRQQDVAVLESSQKSSCGASDLASFSRRVWSIPNQKVLWRTWFRALRAASDFFKLMRSFAHDNTETTQLNSPVILFKMTHLEKIDYFNCVKNHMQVHVARLQIMLTTEFPSYLNKKKRRKMTIFSCLC